MGFRKVRVGKELEIISLIDVVFLLIIFALTVALFEDTGDPGREAEHRLSLELSRLAPVEPDTLGVMQVIIRGSYRDAGRADSALFPPDEEFLDPSHDYAWFQAQDACRLIQERVAYFAENVRTNWGDSTVTDDEALFLVTPDTKMQIVAYVNEIFEPYRDRLPKIKTMPRQ